MLLDLFGRMWLRVLLTAHQNPQIRFKEQSVSVTARGGRKYHILARFSMGMQQAKIVKAPFTMPEPPMPATARPTMNILDDVATPLRREPSSKRPRKNMKVNVEGVSWIC
jgi:hypothetical protein